MYTYICTCCHMSCFVVAVQDCTPDTISNDHRCEPPYINGSLKRKAMKIVTCVGMHAMEVPLIASSLWRWGWPRRNAGNISLRCFFGQAPRRRWAGSWGLSKSFWSGFWGLSKSFGKCLRCPKVGLLGNREIIGITGGQLPLIACEAQLRRVDIISFWESWKLTFYHFHNFQDGYLRPLFFSLRRFKPNSIGPHMKPTEQVCQKRTYQIWRPSKNPVDAGSQVWFSRIYLKINCGPNFEGPRKKPTEQVR